MMWFEGKPTAYINQDCHHERSEGSVLCWHLGPTIEIAYGQSGTKFVRAADENRCLASLVMTINKNAATAQVKPGNVQRASADQH
jgi:hypothetical protein